MKKTFIKMNENDNHLSIGNLFRIIKEISKNKVSALQSELFCILFDINDINDTTVNNYCVGCRSIGSDYKQIFLNKEKKYQKDNEVFCDNIIGLISIMDSNIHVVKIKKIDFINNNLNANLLAKKLYNISKNDRFVDNEFSNKLSKLLKSNKIYECLVSELIYIVLYKKQPLYEDDLKKEVLEDILNDTSISSISLEEYLSLKLREGINYDFTLKRLALKGNAYANFEMGCNEYYGYYKGYSRYEEAYCYFKESALMNHSTSNYMIGNMYIKGMIGGRSEHELKCGYEYLLKAYNLGNVAASNLIGYMYLNGIYPLEKDMEKACKYFKEASENDYAFAYNNLGKIEEDRKNYKEAFEYYKKAANLGESWACNKVGEYYRKGIIEKNMKLAFKYYNDAIDGNIRTLCFYAYYNLAKYFYKDGYAEIVNEAAKDKAIEYLEIAANHNIICAIEELFYIYVERYLKTKDENDYNKLMLYKEMLENSDAYGKEMKEKIEKNIDIIKEKENKINIDLF